VRVPLRPFDTVGGRAAPAAERHAPSLSALPPRRPKSMPTASATWWTSWPRPGAA
jgi:hypothetical protein